MSPAFELERRVPTGVDAVVVPFTVESVEEGTVVSDLDRDGLDVDRAALARQGFTGKAGQVTTIAGGAGDSGDLAAVGVGPAAEVTPAVIRAAAADAARALCRHATVAVLLLDALAEPTARPAGAQALAEGVVLGGYRFDRYKSSPGDGTSIERVVVVGPGGARVARSLELGTQVASGIIVARDLVNTPGGDLTAPALAQVASEIAQRENLQLSILDEHDIAAAGLGGLLGVNRGSSIPPRFIELCWEPDNPKATLALVGKGITFDSGGLSIKTGEGMMTMKDDMGGAAALLGAFSAISAVAPKARVRGYIPATDNMSGGDATRPGDVLKIRNGKTVEVLNTDAEGRLVLADALSLASEAGPDAIVDLATLTGAVDIALGNRIAGLMGNRQSWIDQVAAAAERAGEWVWQLPLPADYRTRLDSDVADLRNVSKTRGAGTLTAGLFLQEFVGEGIPWAHLDIAGTAWNDGTSGELSPGGTGWGVRTILELAATFKRPR